MTDFDFDNNSLQEDRHLTMVAEAMENCFVSTDYCTSQLEEANLADVIGKMAQALHRIADALESK